MKVNYRKLKETIENRPWILFGLILLVGMYLRFYRIESVKDFAWDQARDSWAMRDLLMGRLPLVGPRTGIGHFHLGPAYFYLLAPFYYVMNFDPMALNIFNFLANIFNFLAIYWVTKKTFNSNAALFVSFVYAVNNYLIDINMVPWNVTLMIGVAMLIFYGINQIYKERYKWVFGVWVLSGFYFNLHFTAIFIPFIVLASLIFVKNKIRVFKYSLLSLPFYLIWFVPNLIYELGVGDDVRRFNVFLGDYYIGFHFRFLLHRLSDALVHFGTILYFSGLEVLKFGLPVIFLGLMMFKEKSKEKRLLGYLISLWFIIPWVGFTFYGGQLRLPEYYFLYNAPLVIYVFWYIQEKILGTRFKKILLILLLIFWGAYGYFNTKDSWIKPKTGGLKEQKADVRKEINQGGWFEFNEGKIKSYMYLIWKEDGVEWWKPKFNTMSL